jgi:hypothetical protein
MFTTEIPVIGLVDLVLRSEDGNIIHEVHDHNIVTSVGRDYFARKVGSDPSLTSEISHISIGSSDLPTPRVSDVALTDETATSAITTTLFDFNTLSMSSLFDSGVGTGTVGEAGLYTNDASRKLLCRITFPPFTKGASEPLSVQWKLKFG